VHDPRHLVGLAAQLPLAAQRVAAQTVARVRGRKVGRPDDGADASPLYPSALVLEELQGMPRGPLAYLRSRGAVRTWSAAHPNDLASE
jgi:hypothetical protein